MRFVRVSGSIVRCYLGGIQKIEIGRGNFAVVGRQKSLFVGALIGPKPFFFLFSLPSLHVIFKFMPRAQQHTNLLIPCAHGKLNVKHYRTIPKPETHITRRGRSRAGEKIENRAPKRIQAQQQQRHSHHHPPTRLPPTHTTARNIIIGWNLYEYVG